MNQAYDEALKWYKQAMLDSREDGALELEFVETHFRHMYGNQFYPKEVAAPVHHFLKTDRKYYRLVENGTKCFELRFNDRSFKVGDFIHLEETVCGIKTGNTLSSKCIQFILEGPIYGLHEGWCILQFNPPLSSY